MTELEHKANEEARHGNRDALEELQSKLNRLAEALESIAGEIPYADDPYTIARTALEELKELRK